ncbi:MAG: hypothetical protein KDA98_07960, partial [Acidimicrobiales bacterium]|nr:hypothetical protein [Acidimicrobiales bacterium]
MGFRNPPVPWSELQRRLEPGGGAPVPPEWADGGDGPAWSRKRPTFEPPSELRGPDPATVVPYAELHCHSNFSFGDG